MKSQIQVQETAANSENVAQGNQGLNLDIGDLNRTWAKYDLYSAPIFYKGAEGGRAASPYKAIMKSDRLVAIMSSRYALLPNEEALAMTDAIAKKAGFASHSIHYGRNGNYVCATYLNAARYSFDVGTAPSRHSIEDDEDYEALARAKGDKSWKDFIMQLAKK